MYLIGRLPNSPLEVVCVLDPLRGDSESDAVKRARHIWLFVQNGTDAVARMAHGGDEQLKLCVSTSGLLRIVLRKNRVLDHLLDELLRVFRHRMVVEHELEKLKVTN